MPEASTTADTPAEKQNRNEYADRTARLSSAAENATRLLTMLVPQYGQRPFNEVSFGSTTCEEETPESVSKAREVTVIAAFGFLADYYAFLQKEIAVPAGLEQAASTHEE